MKILVVDDEAGIRECLKEMLEMESHQVVAIGNPLIALSRMKKEHIDLLITDLRMPEISGEELVTRVRESNDDIPIIVITGELVISPALTAVKGLKVMHKPLHINELYESLKAVS